MKHRRNYNHRTYYNIIYANMNIYAKTIVTITGTEYVNKLYIRKLSKYLDILCEEEIILSYHCTTFYLLDPSIFEQLL